MSESLFLFFQYRQRINKCAVFIQRKMNVRPRRPARVSDCSDYRSLIHACTALYIDALHVSVHRLISVAMRNNDIIAVNPRYTDYRNRSVKGRFDRGPLRRRQIYPRMKAAFTRKGVPSVAERRGQSPLNGINKQLAQGFS